MSHASFAIAQTMESCIDHMVISAFKEILLRRLTIATASFEAAGSAVPAV